MGHHFQLYDTEPNEDALANEMVYEVIVPNQGVVGINNFHVPHIPQEGLEDKVRQTLRHEWTRHLQVKRTFTPLGFNKGRLPDDMYASLGAYYYNNRNPPNKVREEWTTFKGVFVNYWETDCNFIQIPWRLKKRWQDRLRELTEAWAGVELDITDMYGMREYTKGARLLTHVDRVNTHAASMIINIAQENVTKPWTVEVCFIVRNNRFQFNLFDWNLNIFLIFVSVNQVLDHADRLHEVVMEPGDIVYYGER